MPSFALAAYAAGHKHIGADADKGDGGRYDRNRNVYHKEKRRRRVSQNGRWTDVGICLYQQITILTMGSAAPCSWVSG